MASSGTTNYLPAITDLVIEAYSRIQVRGPELTATHLIEARRSLNLILQDWSGNRSVNLWAVDLLTIPLTPGVSIYTLPADTIQVLDVYLRSYTPAATWTTLGSALTPILNAGVPVVAQDGDPMVIDPGSGVLSSTKGSQTVTMTWPAHGLSVGDPVFFNMPSAVGGIVLFGTQVVASVIDINTLTLLAAIPAVSTSPSMGAPPLLATTSGSANVTVYLPGHGLSAGDSFAIQNATTVGGLTLAATSYTVATVPNAYSFTIPGAAGNATSTTAVFEFGGQIQTATQLANNDPIDIIMYGLSRSEYAAIPDKFDQGRPTSFWLDRTVPPKMAIWQPPPTGQYYGMAMYRMRQIQDANPVSGQSLDMPTRFMPVFTAELTAALAEKYRPEAFPGKAALAAALWTRAAQEDRELVPWYITPGLSGYFN